MDSINALMIGSGLGLVHYAGLWWTLRRALCGPHPALLVGLSYIVRTGVTVGAFYVVMNGDWLRLVALTAGFTLARLALSARVAARVGPFRTGG